MKVYHFSDFEQNEAWLVFRLDLKVAEDFVDLYMMMHLPSGYILGHEIIEQDILQKHIDSLFQQGLKQGNIPKRILLRKNEPAEPFLKKVAEQFSVLIETVPSASLEHLLFDIKQSHGSKFITTTCIALQSLPGEDELTLASARQSIPDSFDLCPCASGKKYKFCCKKIFVEIMYAMTAAEEGNQREAIQWRDKAKSRVGETAEVLCRESIVYSFFDEKLSQKLLNQCLTSYPKYPRAYYIHAINFKEQGDFNQAILSYQTAIAYYSKTDHYHLNEAYNNLGIVYYRLNDLAQAKIAWEMALLYLPSDKMAQGNLQRFIYSQQDKVLQ